MTCGAAGNGHKPFAIYDHGAPSVSHSHAAGLKNAGYKILYGCKPILLMMAVLLLTNKNIIDYNATYLSDSGNNGFPLVYDTLIEWPHQK